MATSVLVSLAVVTAAVLTWALLVMPTVRWWRYRQYRRRRRPKPH